MLASLCRVHCGCVLLQVLPGGRIPADGELVVGSSYINEAMITGESQPVMKRKGDALIGGTINTGEHLDQPSALLTLLVERHWKPLSLGLHTAYETSLRNSAERTAMQ